MDLGEIPPSELLLPGEEPLPPHPAPPQALLALPGLRRLLRGLGGSLGGEGLSPALRRRLRQAEGTLGRARGLWLHLELLWSLLGELIRDPQNLQPQVLQSLEQELIWAQLRRGPQNIPELLPPRGPPPALPGLLPELQRRLRQRREEIQTFLLGGPKNPPKTPKNPPNPPEPPENPPEPPRGPGLGRAVREQRLRLQRERLRERLLSHRLESAGWEYPQVLSRCLALLSQLCSLRQLQAHLDEGRGRYLQAKGGATLLKSRLEELRVLLDTYPAPTVEAHRRIRAQLCEARRTAEAEAAILGAELAALRGLGPDFRQLALELGRLRQDSARKRWALSQLRPPPP